MADKTVHEAASRLLHNYKVAARVETLQRAVASRVEIQEADILRNAYSAMVADPRRILTPQGQFLPVDQWPQEIRLCIDSFVLKQIPGTDGEVVKVKFSSRTQARDQLMKHAGLFANDNVRRSDGLTAKLDGMSDEALAAMEEILDAVIQESDEDRIWEDGSEIGTDAPIERRTASWSR